MVNNQKAGKLLLLSGLAVCVLQIWLPHYFLTGDGPCHIYNAQVLHDLWCGNNTAFYPRFFSILYQPNPNWFTTFVMALLLFIVKGVITEKVFLTIYLFVFAGGFYLLLKKISNDNPYWPLVLFIFVFTHLLFKGFYNFSFSIAFYFWMVWSWLRFSERGNIGNALLFFLFATLAFFTHILAFAFGAFTCAMLVVSYTLATTAGNIRQKITGYFLKQIGVLLLLLAPCLLLTKWFAGKEGSMQIQLHHHFYRLVELVSYKYIVAITHREGVVALIAGIVLLVLFCCSLVRFKKSKDINKYDGFLLSLLLMAFMYLFLPEDFPGGFVMIPMRIQVYVFITIVCCISYMQPSEKLKSIGGIVSFVCFLVLTIVRIPCQLTAADGVDEYNSSLAYIKPYSVVLPLNFSPGGKDKEGSVITDRNWLFCHTAEYLGLEKPLIILDNYEASVGYFPIAWNNNVNPYWHLSKGEGIEGVPPYAVINEYKQTAGVAVDYVLMWCYTPSFLQNEHFSKLYAEINDGYRLVYTSTTGRILLFEKKEPK